MGARLNQSGGAKRRKSALRAAQFDWSAAAIPYTAARLSNGLCVVVHRDSKAPLAAVQVTYLAGSRDEPAGKAGLAHLCEHLMYTGTAATPGSYFAPFERAGATEMNARVAEDYSTYFATVPAASLELALSMEADRMAHLAAALDAVKIERQREVVRNELRQREAEPFGVARRLIAALAHSDGHPYSHPPNGMLEQLDNLTYADVIRWLESNHGAANAVLVIAGDVNVDAAIKMAERHFGSIPAGKRTLIPSAGLIRGKGTHTAVQPGLKSSRVYLIWHVCACGAPDYVELEAACTLLRFKALQWCRGWSQEQLATEVTVDLQPRVLGSLLLVSATTAPNTPPDRLTAALFDELARLSSFGLSDAEMDALRLQLFANLARECERVGGPRGKADKLTVGALPLGNPDHHARYLHSLDALTSDSFSRAVGRLIKDEPLVLKLCGAASCPR